MNDDGLLRDKQKVSLTTIQTATDEILRPSSVGKWDLGLSMKIRGTDTMTVDNVLHVAECSSNLLSVSHFCDIGLKVTFDKTKVTVTNSRGTIGQGQRV